jgi:16S rRNA (adenine1518-N6/adenine1519-N6)-dimethyltransferase
VGRRLGQHFLFDTTILERIARAACPAPGATVVEIGPGPGGLTAQLLERAARLVAIELDPALASALRERYADAPRFTLVEGDVLATDLAQWGRVTIAGNIPYYITSPIVEASLAIGARLERAVFLVQREVAERLCAAPGSRDYGYLSVAVQVRARVKTLFVVKPGAFKPPPKVESAVVLIEPYPEPLCADLDGFLRFASACFQHKRKTLRNNLAGVYERTRVDALSEAALRAEQISVGDLARLFNILKD